MLTDRDLFWGFMRSLTTAAIIAAWATTLGEVVYGSGHVALFKATPAQLATLENLSQTQAQLLKLGYLTG